MGLSLKARTRGLAGVLALLLFGSITPAATGQSSDIQPNIIFIMLDDAGYNDFEHQLPDFLLREHIDHYVSQGFVFKNFYVWPMCSPTRAAILSGHNPASFNITQTTPASSKRGLPTSLFTPLPEVLANQGYHTRHFGKWHLGNHRDEFLPLTGTKFTHAVRMRGSHVDPWLSIDQGAECPPEFKSELDAGILTRCLPLDEDKRLKDEIAVDEAVRFLESSAIADEPFFLNIWLNAPHQDVPSRTKLINAILRGDPGLRRPDLKAAFADSEEGRYLAFIKFADVQIGKIRAALDENSLAANTIVMITSDNGGQADYFDQSNFAAAAMGKGTKGHVHEGGIREPLIVYCPVAELCRSTDLTESEGEEVLYAYDLYATIADVAGASMSDLDGIGRSFKGLLTGTTLPSPSPAQYWLRKFKSKYSQLHDGKYRWAARDGDCKLLMDELDENGNEELELYDIRTDPLETTNKAADACEEATPDQMRDAFVDWKLEATNVPLLLRTLESATESPSGEYTIDHGGRVLFEGNTLFDVHEGDFTFAAQIRPTSLGGERIVAKKNGAWVLYLDGAVLKLEVTGEQGNSVVELTLSADEPVLEANTNYDVGFTIYGIKGGENSSIRLYVRESSNTLPLTPAASVLPDQCDPCIEAVAVSLEKTKRIVLGHATKSFEGTIENPRVWVVTLSPQELDRHFSE